MPERALCWKGFQLSDRGILGFLCGHWDWAGGGYRTRRNTVSLTLQSP